MQQKMIDTTSAAKPVVESINRISESNKQPTFLNNSFQPAFNFDADALRSPDPAVNGEEGKAMVVDETAKFASELEPIEEVKVQHQVAKPV